MSHDEDLESTQLLVRAMRVMNDVVTTVYGSVGLTPTLDAIAWGVIECTCFGVAAINLMLPSGNFEVVSVEGSAEARSALLGVVEPAAEWERVFDKGQDLQGLRFLDHRDELVDGNSMFAWVPDLPESDNPDLWHPMDTLVAPLVSPTSGELLGALSVDVPDGGRRPGPAQLDVLRMFAGHAALAIERARLHTELEISREALKQAAWHDQLTGLANRTQLAARARELGAGPPITVAVLVADLDGFKAVNDTAGHDAGDELLTVIAQRLRGCLRERDLPVRLGGDEFAIIITGADADQSVARLCERLRTAVAEPIRLRGGATHHVTASVGVAIASTPVDLYHVLAQADAAMYRDKANRRYG